MNDLLNGTLSGAILDFVLLNSAALLFVAGMAKDLKHGVELARKSISSGQARIQFDLFRNATIN
jgi:anthranilate phosphoribosyltransferase